MSAHCALSWNIVAGLLLLGLAGQTARGQAPENSPKPAARVNGEAISQDDLQKLLDSRPDTVPLPKKLQHELRVAALDVLIDDLLIRQFLHNQVPAANPAEVDKEWGKLKETMSKENKSIDDFLREAHQTAAQVRADIAARVQWNTYLHTHLTDAELRTYYQANKLFFDKTFVKASHILVKVGIATADRQKAQQKLEYIRQEIVGGKISFEDAARKYSDCPSKDKGGDVGQFPFKFIVVEPFAKAAFAMKVNDISDIVTSESGLHLIKVTGRVEGTPSTFEDVKETVREVYAKDTGIYNRVLADQRRTAKIEILVE